MAYTRTTWVERAGTLLNRFTKSNETTTSVELTLNPETVTEAGTNVTAARMNNIEQGIVDAHAKIPTITNNNILLSDGAGNAKDSTVQIGNASGNVPLANGTKCENLVADRSEKVFHSILLGGGSILTKIAGLNLTQGEYHFNFTGSDFTDVPTAFAGNMWIFANVEVKTTQSLSVKLSAFDNHNTFERNLIWGTWEAAWTQLTDASGKAVSANSLGGKAAASYVRAAAVHEVKASRAKGTTYTNSNAFPILVSVSLSYSSTDGYVSAGFFVNSVDMGGFAESQSPHTSAKFSHLFTVVPAGGTYKLECPYSYVSIAVWVEVY